MTTARVSEHCGNGMAHRAPTGQFGRDGAIAGGAGMPMLQTRHTERPT